MVLAGGLAAACGGSTAESPSPSASAPAQLTPSASAATTPVALDPCSIVTSAEASTLAGASFGAGREETTGGGGKTCVYGYQTLNVFTIVLAQASDPATAQAAYDQAKAQAQSQLSKGAPSGVKFTVNLEDASISGADRASAATGTATLSGQTISISAVYVLKGAVFFSFSDLVLGHAAPALSAMEAQATTSAGRLP
jgi:hypothetical protein